VSIIGGIEFLTKMQVFFVFFVNQYRHLIRLLASTRNWKFSIYL
jgi:hypothetical protein